MLFLMPLYLQSGSGGSALLAGIELLPLSVAFLIDPARSPTSWAPASR
jgi:hypothetical protein